MIEDTKHVVQVSSNISQSCQLCNRFFPVHETSILESQINHYIEEHGYRLLHVGTETDRGDDGLYHSTVGVLGK